MSKVVDLSLCFPEPVKPGVSRGPLPKQAEFMRYALDENGPRYLRYVGGVGSGKSLIGCVTMIAMAVSKPGDYLIARQFMPELRDTTYKTFLDLCPPELIIEHRKADATVVLKSVGGTSSILFRGLDEYDKQRSLNLNAFYIDEANQCVEAAFMLLQSRLRGRHWRKGILTQNSGGRDWSWKWFVNKTHITDTVARNQFVNITAPSTENVHLPDGYVQDMLSTWSEARIRREIYADENSFEGQVYSEFSERIHVIKPFAIPDSWTRVVGADHGFRNPACWLWGAVDEDDNVYIYREFYETEWIVDEIVKGHKASKSPGVLDLMKGEPTPQVFIDPSIRAKRGSKNGIPWSNFDEYVEALPEAFPLMFANNDVQAGIDRVKRYLRVEPITRKPKLFIFNNCTNLIEELVQYKYEELKDHQTGKRNERESPRKLNDHACDALRYLIMSRPEPALVSREDRYKKYAYSSLESRLMRELDTIRDPGQSGKDPFES